MPIRFENPILIRATDPTFVWETLVDIADDYFRIAEEEPLRVAGNTLTEGRLRTFPVTGATLFEPWHGDSADSYERLESTLQSIRRYAEIHALPTPSGYQVEVIVFKELEDLAQPLHSTAGAATFNYDDTMSRVINPVGAVEFSKGWIPLGRDVALEQRMLDQVQARLGRVIPTAIGPAGPTATVPGINGPALAPQSGAAGGACGTEASGCGVNGATCVGDGCQPTGTAVSAPPTSATASGAAISPAALPAASPASLPKAR